MILELFDFQFTTIRHKSTAKLQKNIQTTKYQFFKHKKGHTRIITTLHAQTKSIIYCLTLKYYLIQILYT